MKSYYENFPTVWLFLCFHRFSIEFPQSFQIFSDGDIFVSRSSVAEICINSLMHIQRDAMITVCMMYTWKLNYGIMSEHRRPSWWRISTFYYVLPPECVPKYNHYFMITFLVSTTLQRSLKPPKKFMTKCLSFRIYVDPINKTRFLSSWPKAKPHCINDVEYSTKWRNLAILPTM